MARVLWLCWLWLCSASLAAAQDVDLFGDEELASGDPAYGADPEADLDDDAAAEAEEDAFVEDDGDGGRAEDEAVDEDRGLTADEGDGRDAAGWSLAVAVEAGVGTRDLDVPDDGVIYRKSLGLFAVVGVGFQLDGSLGDAMSLGLRGRYQTSVGRKLDEQHTDGSVQRQGVRAHRLELALAPTLRLSEGGQWALAGALGYALTELRPEVHQLVTPVAALSAAFLRVELQLPLGMDALRLRLGPEAQWIFHVSEELRAKGAGSQGLGIGGEAALELLLGQHLAVGVSYRELHAWVSSSQADPIVDVSRFVTARLMGAL